MREIKFRFWKHGQMTSLFNGWSEDVGINEMFALCKEMDYVVMQYTGLKDKNGKEIYEGDIIAWDFEYDSDYDGDMPIVRRTKGKSAIKDIFDRSDYNFAKREGSGVEVIGNIYENPELLKP